MITNVLLKIHYSIARLNDPTVGKFSGIWATTYHEHLSRIHALDQESPDLSRPLMQRICKALLRNGRLVQTSAFLIQPNH
jgi:hypothetical protein